MGKLRQSIITDPGKEGRPSSARRSIPIRLCLGPVMPVSQPNCVAPKSQGIGFLKLWGDDHMKNLGKSPIVTDTQYMFFETHFLENRNLNPTFFAWSSLDLIESIDSKPFQETKVGVVEM